MKNLIITLLSVLALSMTFTGCGGSAGSIASENAASDTTNDGSSDTTNGTSDTVVVNGTEVPAEVNTYGITSSLGTPPANPGQ